MEAFVFILKLREAELLLELGMIFSWSATVPVARGASRAAGSGRRRRGTPTAAGGTPALHENLGFASELKSNNIFGSGKSVFVATMAAA